MTEQLENVGYQTLRVSNCQPEKDPSRLWYRQGSSAEANELLMFPPDALVEPLPEPDLRDCAAVIIILGTGYEG